MKVFIGGDYDFASPYNRFHNADLSIAEIHRHLINPVIRDIAKWFSWADYGKEFTHLLYACNLNGTEYIYPTGWLMTEQTFNSMVADRADITDVRCMHKMA